MTWVLLLAPIVGVGVVGPVLNRVFMSTLCSLLALAPASVFVYLLTLAPTALANPIEQKIVWVSSLEVGFNLRLDGLSLLMALLVTGIGALIVVYAQGYLDDDEGLGRFYVTLFTFMGGMLILVLADNLITLFIGWEATSITSFLLIGYKHKYASARQAALQALIITGSGGLVLLAGLILLGIGAGTFEISTLVENGSIVGQDYYAIILTLILVGAFTKSAQVPFHFWLPGAMEAPAPVSAYLHSATMVKAGVYLLARLSPILSGSDLWFYLLTGVGGATMLVGGWLAWQNTDLKRILAYSTISVLGTLVFLLGLGDVDNHYALEAFGVFLLAHALYKGCLFMAAGAIDHATGTRDIEQLGGLRQSMPLLFASVVIATLSMAGLPLLLGFVGKELIYEATLHAPAYVFVLTGVAVIANAMVGTSAGLVAIKPFLGNEIVAPHEPHHLSPKLWAGSLVLAALSLVFGIVPQLLDRPISAVGEAVTSTKTFEAHLYAFAGFNTAFLLSTITIALAVGLYWIRPRLLTPLTPLRGENWGAQSFYERGFSGILRFASWQTRNIQNGNLRFYIGTVLGTAAGVVGYTLFTRADLTLNSDVSDVRFHEWVVFIIIIIGAVAATRFRSRLAAVAALGVVGFSMALFFILFQAPDLAMTQFAIETLTVILIALVMGRLPNYLSSTPIAGRAVTAIIAGAVGVLMTLIVLVITALPPDSQVTQFFAENSYPQAKGLNIVNVILVDFRALDTLGEITVLAVAGMGVYALSRLRIKDAEDAEDDVFGETRPLPARPLMQSLILATASRYLLPLLLLFSIFVLLRGHNEPGGGFVGGLIAASAFALYTMSAGVDTVWRTLPTSPRILFAIGLFISAASGLFALVQGQSFLTSLFSETTLPAVGKPSTPLLFDVGVYFVVVGVVLTIIFTLFEDESAESEESLSSKESLS